MSRGFGAIAKLLLMGPYIAVRRGYCNPYATCSFSNGTVKWIWISSSTYPSLDIGALHGIIIDKTTGDVYRGYMVYPLNDGDDMLRFYRGPLIIKEAPIGVRPLSLAKKFYRFRCKCGDDFEGDEKALRAHLTKRHLGSTRPSRIEIDAFLQSYDL